MYCFISLLLIGLAAFACASEPVYVVLFMHNEDGVFGNLNEPQTQTQYIRHRNTLVEFGELLNMYNTPFCWQSDWKFLQAVLKYDTPVLMDSTTGKNLVRFLSEDCGITVEAHSHENYGYNYADVAHLIDSLGVIPTDVIGGHVWDPYNSKYADWERFRQPLRGSRYTHAQWRGRILIGSGTPGHCNDPLVSGVWRPRDKYNYWDDDPASDVICIGQYQNDLEGVQKLVDLKKSGDIKDGNILTCAVFAPQSANLHFTREYEQNTLLPLLDMEAAGDIEIVTFTELVDIWNTRYNAEAYIYNAPPDTVPDKFSVRIPSDAAGEAGIFALIRKPQDPRFNDQAPIVVQVAGGWEGGKDFSDFGIHHYGFIEILFNFPGSGIAARKSGGIYDERGPNCISALRDVMQFALGLQKDKFGYRLNEMLDVQPLYSNAGMCGWSNGGNATITASGAWGDSLKGLAWIVNWESPVGDGMPNVDAGRNDHLNPAYHPDTGDFDWTCLSFCDTLKPALGYRGGLYFDADDNGVFDSRSIDFQVPVHVFENKLYYSVQMRKRAQDKGIFCPSHIASPGQTENFWLWRNGENWIQSAVDANPGLMFMVEAGDRDHVQGAPDHPHILVQYNGFCQAGARFVRLNPDRSYIKAILGSAVPSAPDNDAFAVYDHFSIRDVLEPRSHIPMKTGVGAALCEIADRTFYNELQSNINTITLVDVTTIHLDSYSLYPNYPNPFNASTTIRFALPVENHVRLTVYDILGRKIATLADRRMPAGSHSFFWNAEELSSGIYILRLRTGSVTRTQMMNLIK